MRSKQSVTKVRFCETPQIIAQTIDLVLLDLRKHDQFYGIFRNGVIDGTFHSTVSMPYQRGRRISFTQVNGHYNIKGGTIFLHLRPSLSYYFLTVIWIIFSLSGVALFIDSPAPFMGIIPVIMGFGATLLYYHIYRKRTSEFIRIFEHYLDQVKEKKA